jgi:hypothetical protein
MFWLAQGKENIMNLNGNYCLTTTSKRPTHNKRMVMYVCVCVCVCDLKWELFVRFVVVVCPFVLFLIAPLISSNSSYISVPSFESITLLLGKEYKLMSYVRRISSSIMKRTIKGSDDQQFHR